MSLVIGVPSSEELASTTPRLGPSPQGLPDAIRTDDGVPLASPGIHGL
jgi:hypothetical protein